MSQDILVITEHANGSLTDATFELLGKAAGLAESGGGQVIAVVLGAPQLAPELGLANEVLTVEDPALASYTSESYEKVLAQVINDKSPRLVLIASGTQGLDLGAALSALCDAPLAAYVVGIELEGEEVIATAQIYGGKIMAEVGLTASPAICAVTAGAFSADAGRGAGSPNIEAVTAPDLSVLKTAFQALREPEAGDVDITAADLLVAVGRGIGGEDDIELIQEFADAIDAPVAASRPVTDAGWLPKSRQVGKSGQTVKPRAYLTFGISGAPEHLEGMRDSALIIACNTDEQAPIFDVAHYGTAVDLFDLLPALTELVE
jgi:electron transfer flavoprotein alpha subunit